MATLAAALLPLLPLASSPSLSFSLSSHSCVAAPAAVYSEVASLPSERNLPRLPLSLSSDALVPLLFADHTLLRSPADEWQTGGREREEEDKRAIKASA